MLINRMNKRLLLNAILVAILPLSFASSAFAQATVDQITQEGEQRAAAGASEQQRVEQIANQTDDLVQLLRDLGQIEYRAVETPRVERDMIDHEAALENLETTRGRLQALIETEGIAMEEILGIERELERIREESGPDRQ